MTKLSYTIEDAILTLNLSRATLYREISQGRLRTFSVGRRRFVSLQAIEDYIAEREKESNPSPEAA